jgi:hypothetical protein
VQRDLYGNWETNPLAAACQTRLPLGVDRRREQIYVFKKTTPLRRSAAGPQPKESELSPAMTQRPQRKEKYCSKLGALGALAGVKSKSESFMFQKICATYENSQP